MQNKALNKLAPLLHDRAVLFVFKILGIYALWKAFQYYVNHSSGIVEQWWHIFTFKLGIFHAFVTSTLLNLLGQHTVYNGKTIAYPDKLAYITVEEHCLALPAIIIFTCSILLFGGKKKDKLWFIPLGLLAIFVINITRLVFVCVTFVHFSRTFFEINHSYVYLAVTYTLIWLMIMWWMRGFDKPVVKAS